MRIQRAVEEFLLACDANGRSEKTIVWYRSLLGRLALSFQTQEADAITTSELRQYIRSLRHGHYSDDTINAHIRAAHKLFKFLAEEFGHSNPMDGIEYPKMPRRKIPKACSIADVIKLMDACPDTPKGKRDKAIIAFLLDTGARAGGVCSLTVDGLDLERGRAIVVEKGDELLTHFFTEETKELIQAWLMVRRPVSPYVFYSMHTGQKLNSNALTILMGSLKEKAGVTGRVNPHSFRHGFAREYILAGGDMGTLSRILGHKDITTTQNSYAIFLTDELARAHDKFSPMKLIKKQE